jgi:hypothetical protein
MPDRTLTLSLHGDVSLRTFAKAMQHFRGIVEGLTEELAPEAELQWIIDDLQAGSATATVRAVGDEEAAGPVSVAYVGVGRSLARGEPITHLRVVKDEAAALTGILDGEVDYLRFENPEEEATVSAIHAVRLLALEPAIEEVCAAHGGVMGRVQTLSNRGGLRFTLYDTLYDKAVNCYLTEGQEEIMRDVWGQAAVVEGMVTRDPVVGRPVSVRRIGRVTPVSQVAPDAYRLARGAIARSANDDREPEELISAARDE